MSAAFRQPHFEVIKFSKAHLVDFIRAKTGSGPRDEINQKSQIKTLDFLLTEARTNNGLDPAQTIVFEDEYFDKQYAEDFVQYGVRSSGGYSNLCSRIHFFSSAFDKYEFAELLNRRNSQLTEIIQTSYLGFLVVRPIPTTFVARLVINSDFCKGAHLVSTSNEVSLFGIALKIKGVPFTEQDKVVAACASAAIWSYLFVVQEIGPMLAPSLSNITSTAIGYSKKPFRAFPAEGLTTEHIISALQRFNLEPVWLETNIADKLLLFKESFYAYLKNNTPILIGADVYEYSEDKKTHVLLGAHLICVVGFQLDNNLLKRSKDSNIGESVLGGNIASLFLHDDRFGPYQQLKLVKTDLEVGNETVSALELICTGLKVKQFFVPKKCLVGLGKSIRIPYTEVRNYCVSFLYFINKYFDQYTDNNKLSLASGFKNGVWDISLGSSAILKSELLEKSVQPTMLNGTLPTSLLLTANLPKSVWRCRLLQKTDSSIDSPILELLIDATDIPQGKLILAIISHCEDAVKLLTYLRVNTKTIPWRTFDFNLTNQLRLFESFFSRDTEESELGLLFGLSQIPHRRPKEKEDDEVGNAKKRGTHSIVSGSTSTAELLEKLNKQHTYIWLICKRGLFIYGEDIDTEAAKLGHRTLVDGKIARLGGELLFDKGWILNLKSSAYPPDGFVPISDNGSYKHRSPNSNTYLANVKSRFFMSCEVRIDTGPYPKSA
jgi:hypothetical protein